MPSSVVQSEVRLRARYCHICGKPLGSQEKRPGRPRIFCSTECKELETRLGQVGKLLEILGQRGVSIEAGRKLRRRCWGFANSLNQSGRP